MRSFPIEYYVLGHVREDGPVLGYFGENPVPGWIRDHWGQRYRYSGVAPRRADGSFNIKLLQPGEWIVEPGLLYVSTGNATHGARGAD